MQSKKIIVLGDYEKNGYIMKDVALEMFISSEGKIIGRPILQYNLAASNLDKTPSPLPSFDFIENEENFWHFCLRISASELPIYSSDDFAKYLVAGCYFCHQVNDAMDKIYQSMPVEE